MLPGLPPASRGFGDEWAARGDLLPVPGAPTPLPSSPPPSHSQTTSFYCSAPVPRPLQLLYFERPQHSHTSLSRLDLNTISKYKVIILCY